VKRCPAFLVLLAACGDTAPSSHTIDTLPNGTVHVVNNGPSHWADTNGWKLVLEAEHSYSTNSAGAIDHPNYPHLLANGTMVVLDQVAPAIHRYAADFAPLGSFGRKGSGPGEFEGPAMRVAGDTILALDRARLLIFDRDGNYLSEHITPFSDWMGDPDRAGRLPLLGRYRADSDAGVMWWSLTEQRVVDSMFGPKGPSEKIIESCSFVLPYQPSVGLTPTLSGQAWFGITDADRFVLSRTGTDTIRLVENAGRPRFPVDAARLDEMFKEGSFIATRCGPDARKEDVPTQRPAWSWLITDGQDNLWVSRPAAYGRSFDVFDTTGIFLGEVPSPITEAENYYWQGDVVMTVENLEDGGFTLRRYRIKR
jgi:hypothetical protein